MHTIRNIHCHFEGKEVIRNIYAGDPLPDSHQFFSVGFHPWHVDSSQTVDSIKQALEPYLANEMCIAIGECGLDKLKGPKLEIQLAVFEEHIRIAAAYNLPLIIHCVKAFNELVTLRKKYPKGKWVLHGFSKNVDLANQLTQHEIALSFGINLLTKGYLQKAFQETPLNAVFLETDMESPELISELYKHAAQLKSLPLETLEREMIRNSTSFFAHIR